MDTLQRIQEIYRQVDQSLAQLAAECLEKRDFDGATAAIEAARNLAAVTGSSPSAAPLADPVTSQAAAPAEANGASRNSTSIKNARPRKGEFPKPRRGEYPKFVRENETLVKIGWSKSD